MQSFDGALVTIIRLDEAWIWLQRACWSLVPWTYPYAVRLCRTRRNPPPSSRTTEKPQRGEETELSCAARKDARRLIQPARSRSQQAHSCAFKPAKWAQWSGRRFCRIALRGEEKSGTNSVSDHRWIPPSCSASGSPERAGSQELLLGEEVASRLTRNHVSEWTELWCSDFLRSGPRTLSPA